MFVLITLLSACSPPCSERAGVYSGLDENGMEWNLRLSPDNYQYGGQYMAYTLGVQLPAWDNAHTFVVGDGFNRQMCRADRVSLQGPVSGGTSVDGVYMSGDVQGEVDRSGSLFLRYELRLSTPDGLQQFEHEVTVPRVDSVEDWVGDTGDTWF